MKKQTIPQKKQSNQTIKTTLFDPARYLDNEDAIAGYMTDALKTNDLAFIADAIGVVARAYGMKKIAEKTKLSRESLYRSLSKKGNPELATILKVINAMDMRLSVSSAKNT